MKVRRTRVTTVETHSVTIARPAGSGHGSVDESDRCLECQFFVRAANETDSLHLSDRKVTGLARLRRIMQTIRGSK